MIVWPWTWRRRALQAEANLAVLHGALRVLRDDLTAGISQIAALRAEGAALREQVRKMSER